MHVGTKIAESGLPRLSHAFSFPGSRKMSNFS